jgi:hypothetical protein
MGRLTALVLGSAAAETFLNRLSLPDMPLGMGEQRTLNRDSPDKSQTDINVRVFPALLQDRREVLTATSTSGNPNAWSRV